MNNIDKQYQQLLQDILDNGIVKKDRTGTGTLSVFGRQIRHKMSEGFPLLTTKKMAWNVMIAELLWFLRGDTNIKFLLDYDCHIWDGDAYKNYTKKIEDVIDGYKSGDIMGMQPHMEKWYSDSDKLTPLTKEEFIHNIKTDDEFAEQWGELGPIYGKQWRSWGERKHDSISNEYFIGIDQIQTLINELKTNPDSRRLMVSAWNVGELDQMVLPPCHYGFQVYTRELSLEERWEQYLSSIKKIMAKPSKDLKDEEWSVLDKFGVPAWDMIEANSGGHKCITNISALNYFGRAKRPNQDPYRYNPEADDAPYVKFVKMIQREFVNKLKEKINSGSESESE